MLRKLLVPFLILGLFVVVGCDKDDPTEPEAPEYDSIQPALDAYTGGAQGPVVKAADLYANINDGDASNDYFVVSVRSATDYAKGHVPGSINIPWRDIAKAENLAKLPSDKKIAVYCYTGHTAAIATTVLNALGYEAYNMKFAIMAWTKDATVRVQSSFSEDTDAHDYPTETQVNAPTTTFVIPTTDFTTSTDPEEIIRAAADLYASNHAPVIKAADLYANLNDGDSSNDPIVISVRGAADYAKGHIPGSINIPWREISKEENLKKIDPSKQIAVYCYTGHTAGVATTALNMLGYDALNMKWGVMSWTKDATVRSQNAFNNDTDAHDYPTTAGTNP
jgi:rhodanese-related sulfurtransferase